MQHADPQDLLIRFSLLLQLQRRARRAGQKELPFIFVNETRTLLPYRQAVLWQSGLDDTWKVTSVSGLAAPDAGSPFVLWLLTLAKAMRRLPKHNAISPVTQELFPDEIGTSWADWLPKEGLWLPLFTHEKLTGALALFRDTPFQEHEVELLGHLSESYGQCLALPVAPRMLPKFSFSLKNWRVWAAIALVLLLFFPARQSVLVPAEVISLHPAHIRVGLDGVIKNFFVTPNQRVAAGDKLLGLEDDQLRTRQVVAQKDLEMARSELQQTQQISLVDPRSKIRLPMLQGRVEQLIAELALVQAQLNRVITVSPVDGIAVFDDPDAWLGRPVNLGQKVMEVADPAQVQLEITLPMSETLPLQQGDSILFFPNVSPHSPLSGALSFIGYQAAETAEAGLAFTLRAHFGPDETLPRLGLRGTAKLYGERMPLVFLLLRRPFLQARQWLGL